MDEQIKSIYLMIRGSKYSGHYYTTKKPIDMIALLNVLAPAIDPDNRHEFKVTGYGAWDGWQMYPHRHPYVISAILHRASEDQAHITINMRRPATIPQDELRELIQQALQDADIV